MPLSTTSTATRGKCRGSRSLFLPPPLPLPFVRSPSSTLGVAPARRCVAAQARRARRGAPTEPHPTPSLPASASLLPLLLSESAGPRRGSRRRPRQTRHQATEERGGAPPQPCWSRLRPPTAPLAPSRRQGASLEVGCSVPDGRRSCSTSSSLALIFCRRSASSRSILVTLWWSCSARAIATVIRSCLVHEQSRRSLLRCAEVPTRSAMAKLQSLRKRQRDTVTLECKRLVVVEVCVVVVGGGGRGGEGRGGVCVVVVVVVLTVCIDDVSVHATDMTPLALHLCAGPRKSPHQFFTGMKRTKKQVPRQVQLWEHDCLHHDGTCETLANRDVEHFVHVQLRSLHGPQDHGKLSLRHDRGVNDVGKQQDLHNRGIDHLDQAQRRVTMVCNSKTMGICLCTTTAKNARLVTTFLSMGCNCGSTTVFATAAPENLHDQCNRDVNHHMYGNSGTSRVC